MPHRQSITRLRDILEAISNIEQSIDGLSLEAVREDREKEESIILNFFRIGEAVYPLPDELLRHQPDVPWSKIRDMRNLIAHVYWGVDMAILWDTARDHLPALKAAVNALLSMLADEESSS